MVRFTYGKTINETIEFVAREEEEVGAEDTASASSPQLTF